MLIQLRDYVLRERLVTSQQIMREFELDFTALLPMMEVWIKRGVLFANEKQGCRGGCGPCHQQRLIYYQAC